MTHGTASTDDHHVADHDGADHQGADHDGADQQDARGGGTDRSSKVMVAVVGLALAGVLAAAAVFVTMALIGPQAHL